MTSIRRDVFRGAADLPYAFQEVEGARHLLVGFPKLRAAQTPPSVVFFGRQLRAWDRLDGFPARHGKRAAGHALGMAAADDGRTPARALDRPTSTAASGKRSTRS